MFSSMFDIFFTCSSSSQLYFFHHSVFASFCALLLWLISIIHVLFISLPLNGPLAFMFGQGNISSSKNTRQNICYGGFFNQAYAAFTHTHTPLPGPLSLPSSSPSSPSSLSSRVICSVSCVPLLAFPLHLWLVDFHKTLIGQCLQRLLFLTVMKHLPLLRGHSFFLWGRPPSFNSPPLLLCSSSSTSKQEGC